jgi:hypothetical protein
MSLRLAFRILLFNAIYTLTQIPVCNRDPTITIHDLTQSDTGVRPLTYYQVLPPLMECGLDYKAKLLQLGVSEISVHWFSITLDRVGME